MASRATSVNEAPLFGVVPQTHQKEVTVMENLPNEIRYFQTFNKIFKRWNVPMRKLDKRRCVVIKNRAAVISRKLGYAYALYRMAKVFDVKRDAQDRLLWKTEIRKKDTKSYTYYELRVTKIVRDMVGGGINVRSWS
jgi:hypothetical protein